MRLRIAASTLLLVMGLTAVASAGDDCPPLNPVDDGSTLPSPMVMAEIDPGDHIVLYNRTASDIDLGVENFWLCSPFDYANLSIIAGDVVVPAGGYATVPFPVNFTDVDAGGEIILYRDIKGAIQFGDGSRIVDFVCWGVNPHGSRKVLAENVGRWAGSCPTALTNGALRRLPDTDGTSMLSYDPGASPNPLNCTPAADNPFDLDEDGSVGPGDLAQLLAAWGPCEGCPADFDGDGMVGPSDLAGLLANWG